MNYEYLVFDLDGTISDPKAGITQSINYALEHHHFDPFPLDELSRFIGPPLDKTFAELTRSNDPVLIASLVEKYRERYGDIGFSENILYDGIESTLTTLHERQCCKLGVCTAKRGDFAVRILDMFGLLELFSFVNGAEIGVDKWQQLENLLNDGVINRNAIMIGDRAYDLHAANHNQLDCAGVLWGYGSRAELEKEHPSHILNHPEELLTLIPL
ncbi:HAD hydrolase-like protein [Gynuella sunshinyii]|uniref:Putative phosphatase n=1 Tax=Gynuella sunshinyii YC6258 TaxID=1445510 RepID=A0A0C5VV80_9GAMM|nr:HAD hydrolase-like protein [Gynuella sunshinyii]AJQ94314.1 putative phosphatase [Gynuella sunshinyii YC6258]